MADTLEYKIGKIYLEENEVTLNQIDIEKQIQSLKEQKHEADERKRDAETATSRSNDLQRQIIELTNKKQRTF
ncbi:unnamed protein product [Didymodactylos carnosus]|uniref:Uncharacterized protein n=1 Tax=Didymodactylos carnosus TaxID=1234261 RepID=A0A816AUL5_9BILA|nr:unnamed protein product [Didymodactylos carnosus]CAF4479070.1 unnamed protein product [Didymodactylos carnosus]